MATPNPHHLPPRLPLSWDVPHQTGITGGITDDMDTARQHLLDAMRQAPEGAEGIIRRVFPATRDEIDYGPVLLRIRRDADSGALLIRDENEPVDPPSAV